jgi:hypothetical protein
MVCGAREHVKTEDLCQEWSVFDCQRTGLIVLRRFPIVARAAQALAVIRIEPRTALAERHDVIHVAGDGDDAPREAVLAQILVSSQDGQPDLLPLVIVAALAGSSACRLRVMLVAVP